MLLQSFADGTLYGFNAAGPLRAMGAATLDTETPINEWVLRARYLLSASKSCIVGGARYDRATIPPLGEFLE